MESVSKCSNWKFSEKNLLWFQGKCHITYLELFRGCKAESLKFVTSTLFYETRQDELRGTTGCKFPTDADFIGDRRPATATVIREKIKDTSCISWCPASCVSHRSFIKELIILILQPIFVGPCLYANVKQSCKFTAKTFLVMWRHILQKVLLSWRRFLLKCESTYWATANTLSTAFNFRDRVQGPLFAKALWAWLCVQYCQLCSETWTAANNTSKFKQ